MGDITSGELASHHKNLKTRVEFIEDFLRIKIFDANQKIKSLAINQSQKCSSTYSKSELAHFFYLLMDEKILFFDLDDQVSNRRKMQSFIANSFTYKGDAGLQINIDLITKQFSECKGFTYKEKQIRFLDELLRIIQKRKQILTQW